MFIRKYWIPLSVFLIAIAGIGIYLLATQTPKEPIVIYKTVEPLPRETTETEVDESDTSQGGHFHEDGTFHAQPHEPIPVPAEVQVSDPKAETPPQRQYNDNTGAGNPHPWEHVPVDLYDFEATKAAMIENINFFKANWHPFEYNREVSIAFAIIENIDNAAHATQLGLFTPEQAEEIHALYADYNKFRGFIPGRTRQLRDEGYTRKEAIEIAAEEYVQRLKERWGVK